MSSARPPLVLVATHVRLCREGLIAALTRRGLAAQGLDPHLAAGTVRLAAAILVDMTDARATETLQRLSHVAAPLPVVAFAVRDTDVASRRVGGVWRYVMFDSPMDAVVDVVCAAVTHATGDSRTAQAAAQPASGVRPLTPREQEVLGLMLAGPSNRDIATRLRISEATVKHHVHSMLEKLHAGSRTQLVARMTRSRSTPLE